MDNWSFAEWLSLLSVRGVFTLVFASMVAAGVVGHFCHRLAVRYRMREQAGNNQESYLVSGMLGLLALLLAFTFSMALSRYEERRHLVLEDANAIGTAYLRAQLLDEPHRTRLSAILVAYTDNRIELSQGNSARPRELLAKNDALLTELWAAVVASRDSALRHGVSTALLLSYNQLIDLDTSRKVARQVRVPGPVLLYLYAFLILTALVLGFVLNDHRSRAGAAVLFLLLALYVGILDDISRPVSGNIRESQRPLLILRDSLKAQPPAVFDRFAQPENARAIADRP